MTATALPDWAEIAAPGAELGSLHRAELFKVLSEMRQLESLAARSCHALIRHAGGPEAMAEVDREIHAAATDARSAHRLAKAAVQRIERQLAGQA